VKPLNAELLAMLVFLAIFFVVLGLHFSLFYKLFQSQKRAIARLKNLSGTGPQEEGTLAEFLRGTLPKIGTLVLPKEEDSRIFELKAQLLRAGIYKPKGLRIFMGVKLLLMLLLPIPCALVPYGFGLLDIFPALTVSMMATCLGMMAPSLWLRQWIKSRQRDLRRGIPDALDMLVLCLEGGVSLMAGIQRVTSEIQDVHATLAAELNIIHREIQLGLSVGEALRAFAERSDLEEVRDLASVLLQSERIGASVAQALRAHAETSRQDRQQRAEEMAHRTAVKILFPTLLCIFPAIFIVLLGPAAIQMATLFQN